MAPVWTHVSSIAVASFCATATFTASAAATFGGQGTHCTEVAFPVALDDSSPPSFVIRGEFCRPRGGAEVLQILIHGASYNRQYWDFPYKSPHYSYVRRANRAGFATLAIDRLGSGQSDRPPGEAVSVHASASTIHQIVTAVRNGALADEGKCTVDLQYIVLVGHSFGSNISWTEAGLYQDVDGLILTGISHDQDPPAAILTQIYSYPAQYDPLFANLNIPSGYLTTMPDMRDEMFYYVPGASPDVIAADEAHKDTLPIGMLFDQFTTYDLTQNIHVPVLNIVGDFDTLACQLPSCTGSGGMVDEGLYYPEDAHYSLIIVPNAGHSLNLHRNAPSWYRQAQRWVADWIAP